MLCPDGRTTDLQAILNTMSQARHYINIAVMDYIPAMLYLPPGKHQYVVLVIYHEFCDLILCVVSFRFWPDIDDHLRRLAIDKSIQIRLLVSHWNHTSPAILPFLRSLVDISNVYPHVDIQVVIDINVEARTIVLKMSSFFYCRKSLLFLSSAQTKETFLLLVLTIINIWSLITLLISVSSADVNSRQ